MYIWDVNSSLKCFIVGQYILSTLESIAGFCANLGQVHETWGVTFSAPLEKITYQTEYSEWLWILSKNH